MATVETASESPVSVERDGQVTLVGMHTVRTTQPPHAISRNVWIGLASTFTEISRDRDTRVVILTGGNNYFGTGANFDELLQVLDEDERNGNDMGAHEYWRIVNYAHTAIENCQKPVYAMIERFALGAACALAMACDMRIMAENAKIGIPAPQRGLTLGLRDTRRLVSKVGGTYAAEILLEGNLYSAEEAFRMGLVNSIVAGDKLREKVIERAQRLARENAPLAMKEGKK